jgi:hypothetical protein
MSELDQAGHGKPECPNCIDMQLKIERLQEGIEARNKTIIQLQQEIESNTEGWISVEDRLPGEGRAVIVFIKDRCSVITTIFYGDFALTRVGGDPLFQDHGVTHWMYLPSPPDDYICIDQVLEP